MNQPPPAAPPNQPGWAWDQAAQQWVPAGPPPSAPTVLPGPTLGMHLKRAIDWNVSEVQVSPRERARLQAAGVFEPRIQALLAWRRSSLIVVLPILLLSVVLAFVDAGTTDTDGFTDFGKLWLWLPPIGLLLVPLGALRAISGWTELRRSSRLLISCWVLSIALPLLAALVPLDGIVDLDAVRGQALDTSQLQQIEAVIFATRLSLAVNYALTLLPVIISVPSGVLKGAGRVKSLFPAAALPGWFLVSVAPFYSLFMVVVFVLIDQIVGNALLLIGVALLAFSPWLFVIHRRTYGRAMSIQEARTELAKASKPGGLITLAGFVLVVLYLLTAKVDGQDVVGSDENTAVFSYLQVGRTAVEVFGRSIVTAVVFCMIFLTMVFAEWRSMQQLRPEIRAEHDAEMHALRRYTEQT